MEIMEENIHEVNEKAIKDIGNVIAALDIFENEYLSNDHKQETELRIYARNAKRYFLREQEMYKKSLGIKD